MPEVSVIIPNYNHAPYLEQRIESVLGQTFRDFELILLDDRSTDNSREIIERYRYHPSVSQIIYNIKNAGTPFRQWQKGITLAKGKWIWIAESDDYAAPAFLEQLLEVARKTENPGVVYCGSRWVNDKGEEGKDLSSYMDSFCRNGKTEVADKLWHVCTIQNASACLLRRDLAISAIKGLGHYRACGDWMFYIKMLQRSNLAFTGEKLNYFRYYHNNTSNWAEKNGLWITEGVDVLKHMRYNVIKFSPGKFKQIFDFWYERAQTLNNRRKYKVMWTVLTSAVRYVLSI